MKFVSFCLLSFRTCLLVHTPLCVNHLQWNEPKQQTGLRVGMAGPRKDVPSMPRRSRTIGRRPDCAGGLCNFQRDHRGNELDFLYHVISEPCMATKEANE